LSAPETATGLLARHRIGSVPYLNARPLVEGLRDRLTFLVPSRLASEFAAGRLDAALLPVYEAVSRDGATLVDGVAIAARGEVYSVFLAHREPLDALRRVALDPASHTSNNLLRCLFAEYLHLAPEFVAAPEDDSQARLLIGDAALDFRRTQRDWSFLDLGAEWMRWTGLPFVFACWVLRDGLAEGALLAETLRDAKGRGLAARAEIAAEFPDPVFVEEYLTRFIRYELGEEERGAIALFAALLRKHGIVQAPAPVLRYI
jgi:predicted solute-binding protein